MGVLQLPAKIWYNIRSMLPKRILKTNKENHDGTRTRILIVKCTARQNRTGQSAQMMRGLCFSGFFHGNPSIRHRFLGRSSVFIRNGQFLRSHDSRNQNGADVDVF